MLASFKFRQNFAKKENFAKAFKLSPRPSKIPHFSHFGENFASLATLTDELVTAYCHFRTQFLFRVESSFSICCLSDFFKSSKRFSPVYHCRRSLNKVLASCHFLVLVAILNRVAKSPEENISSLDFSIPLHS